MRFCGFALALGPLGCGRDKASETDSGELVTGWSLPLPEGFPVPVVPAENPARAETASSPAPTVTIPR